MNPRYLCGILLLPHQLAQTICAHFRPFFAFASCIAWHFGLLFGGSVLLSSIHHKQTHEMSGVFLGKALAMQLYPQVQLLPANERPEPIPKACTIANYPFSSSRLQFGDTRIEHQCRLLPCSTANLYKPLYFWR